MATGQVGTKGETASHGDGEECRRGKPARPQAARFIRGVATPLGTIFLGNTGDEVSSSSYGVYPNWVLIEMIPPAYSP